MLSLVDTLSTQWQKRDESRSIKKDVPCKQQPYKYRNAHTNNTRSFTIAKSIPGHTEGCFKGSCIRKL
jgi:hypothetical protein